MAVFESNTSDDSDSATLSSYSAGASFVAESNHTITSIDVDFAGGSGQGIIHISNSVSQLPTTDLTESDPTTITSGNVNFVIPCTNLEEGQEYYFWHEYVSGNQTMSLTYPFNNSTVIAGRKIGDPYGAPTSYFGSGADRESAGFTVYGDAGTCAVEQPTISFGTTTVATSTLQLVGATTVGLGIIMVILWLGLIIYINNSLFSKKPWRSS